MGFTKAVKQVWQKAMNLIKHNETGMFSLLGQDYRFGTQSKDFLRVAYGMNPYVFMVIDRISQRLVQIDKLLLNSKTKKEIEDADFQALLDKPNASENGSAFLYRAAATYLAAGECFIVRKQTLGEDDQYFVPVNYNVTINRDLEGNVLDYWVSMYGKAQTYLRHEVLHISKPDITVDTNYGFSTLRAIRKVWESNNEVWASEAALHKNKGITGVLYSDGNRPMTPTEQEELQDKYDTDNTGVRNFGKVKVSTSKLGYIQMGMNPNDLKSIETRLEHLRTTCAAFNVDPKLFGDSAASTYNNMAEAQRAMIVNAVIPLAQVLLPSIAAFMAKSFFKAYTLELDEENITELQLTNDQRSARLGREVIQGILLPEEARSFLYPELASRVSASDPATTEAKQEDEDTVEGNPQAESANAQAQANLRGSVGGVQGILQIQASVLAGATPRESAIVILMQIYGFDEDTANDILG